MRLRLIIKDIEYRDALIEALSVDENDIYVEIPDARPFDNLDDRTLILTDLIPDDYVNSIPEHFRQRIVFLTNSYTDTNSNSELGLLQIFKYSSVPAIVAELAMYYQNITGEGMRFSGKARLVAVAADSLSIVSSDYCRIIARQLKYRNNYDVLIISMNYLNEYGLAEVNDISFFARFMYYLELERDIAFESFVHSDEYGTYYLMLPEGINPVAYLKQEEINSIISRLSRRFSLILLDYGTCWSNENIQRIRKSEKVFYLQAHNNDALAEYLMGSSMDSNLMIINVLNGLEASELLIDDSICRHFGDKSVKI